MLLNLYNLFLLQKQQEELIQKFKNKKNLLKIKTIILNVPRNQLIIPYLLKKKIIVSNGQKTVLITITENFLGLRASELCFTKKTGGNIHLLKNKKTKQKITKKMKRSSKNKKSDK